MKIADSEKHKLSTDEKLIVAGASIILKDMGKRVPGDPVLCVATLLFAAAYLARCCQMTRKRFYEGVRLGWHDSQFVEGDDE